MWSIRNVTAGGLSTTIREEQAVAGCRRRRETAWDGVAWRDAVANHPDLLKAEKARSRRTLLGTLCAHTPVEIFHAFDIVPVRLWGAGADPGGADPLLQSFICPPVRQIMAMGLAGRYDFLDGLVHAYSCDAACGLFNVWRRNLHPKFAFQLSLPYMDTPEALAYAQVEFRRLIEALETLTDRAYEPERLRAAIGLYREARDLLRRAYARKRQDGGPTYADLYRLSLALQVFPVETVLAWLTAFDAAADGPAETGDAGTTRLMISGSLCADEALFTEIAALGGNIVVDDTCIGYRTLLGGAAPEGDPLTALARHHLARPPCSARADFPARRAYFLEQIEAFRVEAVVFIHQKFCDPHLADHPFLKTVLEERGIPSLQVELEGEGLTGQIRTRLEGFFEMIGKNRP